MTAWKLLCETICPPLLATYLNNVNAVDGEQITAEYLRKFNENCLCTNGANAEMCNKCWRDFLGSDVT